MTLWFVMQTLIFFHLIFNQLNAFREDILSCCLKKNKAKDDYTQDSQKPSSENIPSSIH